LEAFAPDLKEALGQVQNTPAALRTVRDGHLRKLASAIAARPNPATMPAAKAPEKAPASSAVPGVVSPSVSETRPAPIHHTDDGASPRPLYSHPMTPPSNVPRRRPGGQQQQQQQHRAHPSPPLAPSESYCEVAAASSSGRAEAVQGDQRWRQERTSSAGSKTPKKTAAKWKNRDESPPPFQF
jgi:hypothetical protein